MQWWSLSEECHHLVEPTVRDPAQKPYHYGCSTRRVGKPVFDGPDVATDFLHVPADILQMCLQFDDARFHFSFSIEFGAVAAFGVVVGSTFRERCDRCARLPEVMAVHNTSLYSLRMTDKP